MPTTRGPVVLVLFDGWGHRSETFGNTLAAAETPNYDQLWEAYPHVLLEASGPAVGLSPKMVGSAAAGYATIAAGRAIEQPPLRLDKAVERGTFRSNEVLVQAATETVAGGGRVHLLGVVSDGQVISSERHYFELLGLLAEAGVPGGKVFVHAILDGYDTPPRSGMNYLARFAAEMMRTGIGRVATMLGRGYGLASTGGWGETERAYAALVHGAGRLVPSAIQAIQSGYSRGEDDTSLSPAVVLGPDGLPLGRLEDGDLLICFDHREDGLRRLLQALLADSFEGFAREQRTALRCVALTQYSFAAELGCAVAFPAPEQVETLGSRLAADGRRIGLVAESFMESHLRRLVAGAGAERVTTRFLPSPPLDAVTDQPGRLVEELTSAAVELISGGECHLIVVDYVNADLAGHQGDSAAARQAVEALDAALSPLVRAARKVRATVLLSSCYGNVEALDLPNAARPNPAHTTNPVPLLLINDAFKGYHVAGGGPFTLADLAPTIFGLLGATARGELPGQDLVAALAPIEEAGETEDAPPAPMEISAVEAIGMCLVTDRHARAYYLSAADQATDADSATLYRHLAGEEARRLKVLEQRFRLLEPTATLDAPPSELADIEPPPRGLAPLEVIELAIQEELDTYRLLTDMAARNLDPQGTATLEQLATEELAMLARLQEISESEAIRLLSAATGP